MTTSTETTEAAVTDIPALTRLRLERGWSLRELADIIEHRYDIKVDHGQLGRIERGDTKVPFPPLRAALCDLYELDITYFDRDKRTTQT